MIVTGKDADLGLSTVLSLFLGFEVVFIWLLCSFSTAVGVGISAGVAGAAGAGLIGWIGVLFEYINF